ncbi:DUF1740-domain-containing protein [Lichtheimia hyalospora FSU 10163]|nr:DUF1740-domain-containing protein [Lichtheimia hyalospora FSU 10163]
MDKRTIPPPPRISSAPSLNNTPRVPTFSSAPDLSELTSEHREQHKSKKHKRDRSPRRHSRSPRRRRHRSRSPKQRSRSPRHRRRSRERHHRRYRSPTSPPPPLHSGQLETGCTFVIDKRGDMDNLKYGELERSTVPEYHRSGGGLIIGIPTSQKIDLASAKSGKVLKIVSAGSRKKPTRYMDAGFTWQQSGKRIRIKPSRDDDKDAFSDVHGFVGLESDHKKPKNENEQAISSGVDYRSIEGPKTTHEISSDEEESDQEGETFDEYVRRRTIEQNRHLDENPNDVDAWLAFIEFQDEASQGVNTVGTKANKTSMNEVKMSIFEKAMQNNPMDEKLLLSYLSCGEQIWDTLTLLREWDKALKKRPESIRLWADYINLRQTNFSSFSFTECVKVFEDCILTLNKVARRLQRQRKHEDNYDERENIESVMVYVFLRGCLFMKQAGYHERAFGCLQAIVEFTLFQPQSLRSSEDTSFGDLIDEFCEFWDTEVARFGEEGAKGWHHYYSTKNEQGSLDVPEAPEDANKDDIDVFSLQDWVRLEESKELQNRLPLRIATIDPHIVDEDPYVVTLSDDIRDFLFDLTTYEARQALIYSIFVFLGLPFPPPGVGTNTHFCTDTFTHNEMKFERFWPPLWEKRPLLITYVDGIPMEPEHAIVDRHPFDYPVSYPVGVSELFARHGHWFACMESCHLDCESDINFARNAFAQLNALQWNDHLAICHLSLESSISNKSAKKLAKEMLKDRSNNLILWNVYAQMEKSHGRLKEARRVYQTALASYRQFPEPDQQSAPLLYSAFAQLEWEEKRPEEALKILVSMATEEPYAETNSAPSNAQILKAHNYYMQKTAQVNILVGSEHDTTIAHHYNVCYALLQYITRGVEAASEVYERGLEYIKERQAERGFESEVLWVAYARLLYQHAVEGGIGYKPSQMRVLLERALALFPNNTIFISLHVWNETRTKIYNRVRKFFTQALDGEPNVMLWLSAIRSELHRHHPYDINLVRSLFESAVDNAGTRASILVWKLYIEHEIRCKNMDRAKSLYYRAVRACPWSKELYLLGIRVLSRQLSEKELHEMVSLMMEKEIRMRCTIDDTLLGGDDTIDDENRMIEDE